MTAEGAPIYDELSIRFQPIADGRYRTLAAAADGSTASAEFIPPFSDVELDNFVLRMGRQRAPVRNYRSKQMEEAKRIGSRLFEELMVDGVRDVFRSARGAAETSQKGLRISLCFSGAPELMDLPWEFMYEKPRFLSQSIYSPVVRSLDLSEVPAGQVMQLPLNVLGMISSPAGFDNLDVAHEIEKLELALAPLCSRGLVTLEWLRQGSLRELDEAISRRREVHVFHYIGHGGYDSVTDAGVLLLEDERGEPHEVSGEELGLLLQDERSLRLAVLNSCEGARSSHLDPFSGAASGLVQYGVPAVIGMQFEITDQAALAFASRLYVSLAQGFPVDAALAQARRSIFAAGNDVEFGTPVLFLRGADARLWEVLEPASASLALDLEVPDPELPAEDLGEDGYEAAERLPLMERIEPGYKPWLPRPWQESWRELRADVSAWLLAILRRLPNGPLAVLFVGMIVVGTLVTTLSEPQASTGKHQSTLGAILVDLGALGLIAVAVRALHAKVSAILERLRNWWTGNG